MPRTKPLVRSSAALWDTLKARAGLKISRKPKALASYDDAIDAQLRTRLGLPATGSFRRLLIEQAVSVEELLTAFLQAAAPFSQMLNRILQLYQAAAAKHGEKNLELAIQFGRLKDQKLKFDLKAFTRQVKVIEKALITLNARKWTDNDLFGIQSLIPTDVRSAERPKGSKSAFDTWIADYRTATHSFPAMPPFQRVGKPDLDEFLLTIAYDFNAFISRARELFGTYDGINDAILPDEPADRPWPATLVKGAAHDRWPVYFAKGLQILCESLIARPDDASSLLILQNVKSRLDALRVERVTHEERLERLLEVLSLPVWKRREAMYSVWVCAASVLDLRHCEIRYDVKDGKLEFPFAARRIATITQAQRPGRRLEFWSELRTPARDLAGKRKAAIQPDYRYRSIQGEGEPVDVAIIECKQYKKSSASNFSAALADYARACPTATVILCNYGPVLPNVLDRVKEIEQSRPIEVVVLNCWVTATNETPCASNSSTSLAKSASDRVSRSTL
jgi:hypothetical protein